MGPTWPLSRRLAAGAHQRRQRRVELLVLHQMRFQEVRFLASASVRQPAPPTGVPPARGECVACDNLSNNRAAAKAHAETCPRSRYDVQRMRGVQPIPAVSDVENPHRTANKTAFGWVQGTRCPSNRALILMIGEEGSKNKCEEGA